MASGLFSRSIGGTQWGTEISQTFQDREGNLDNYGKHSFLEYLDFIENPYTYGTEYDIIMLCAFLNISIDVYTSSLLSIIGGKSRSEGPLHRQHATLHSFLNRVKSAALLIEHFPAVPLKSLGYKVREYRALPVQ